MPVITHEMEIETRDDFLHRIQVRISKYGNSGAVACLLQFLDFLRFKAFDTRLSAALDQPGGMIPLESAWALRWKLADKM
jgi:hypothetical protein